MAMSIVPLLAITDPGHAVSSKAAARPSGRAPALCGSVVVGDDHPDAVELLGRGHASLSHLLGGTALLFEPPLQLQELMRAQPVVVVVDIDLDLDQGFLPGKRGGRPARRRPHPRRRQP